MFRTLLPVSALLFGSGLLLFAGGIHGLILPLRGGHEGFSTAALGLLGTGWAIGFVTGCVMVPRMVGSVGHIRTFGVMCSLAAVAILTQALMVDVWVWIPVRAISGFCFAGAAMIVESWLSERAEPNTRGRIFGLYTMVNLGGATAGQLVISLGDTTGVFFFMFGAIIYCLALIPTALSTSKSPTPLTSVELDIKALWRNSPVSVVAAFLIGTSNASFGTLAAVYADQIGLALATITIFASLPILLGAVCQIPVGYLSDRIDRRFVLIGVAVLALCADTAFIWFAPEDATFNLVLAAIFGAAIFTMYPISVAHANDHAPAGTAIQVSGGHLLILGLGSISGPLIGGIAMAELGPSGLFYTTACTHVLLILFTVWRITQRAAVETEDKGAFQISSPARLATPQTEALARGSAGEGVHTEAPQPEGKP
ncbi:MAG: MFS transporter [Pseudomonadota bacterium]